MKPIQVENSYDCRVSVQVSPTTINDKHASPVVVLLIEDENGDHIATFTPRQTKELMKALLLVFKQITGAAKK